MPRVPTPTLSTQSALTNLDGNAQPQDSLPAGLPTTNKIKINITKNVTNKIVINTSENSDKTSSEVNSSCDSPLPATAGNESATDDVASNSGGGTTTAVSLQSDETPQRRATPEPEPEIEFEFKESMRNKQFQRMTRVHNGLETSGLCSIM